MPDFFNDQDGQDNNNGADAPETVKVGDKEYSQEELAELVKMGEFGKEVETKLNTKLDKVYPNYTRNTQELKELKAKIEELEQAGASKAEQLDPEDEVAIKKAREAAKKIGLVTNDDIKDFIKSEFPNFYKEHRATEKLLEQASTFEEKYNGKDGKPVFRSDEMLEFMRDSGITSPETAYKVRFEKELDEWKADQLAKSKKSGFYTDDRETTGSKQPVEPRPNKENLERLIQEALYGSDTE